MVGQKLLEAIFGEDAVRRLSQRARASLKERTLRLLGSEADRFKALLEPEPGTLPAAELAAYSGRLAKLTAEDKR